MKINKKTETTTTNTFIITMSEDEARVLRVLHGRLSGKKVTDTVRNSLHSRMVAHLSDDEVAEAHYAFSNALSSGFDYL